MLTTLRQKIASDPLLDQTGFRRYWLSSIMTSFGTHIGALALPLCAILVLHATPAQVGILTACQVVLVAVLALPAGVWLDRRRRMPLLLACKFVQGISLASVPLAWSLGWLSMGWLYAVALIQGACSVLGVGAEQIVLTFMIGRERMIDAQARLMATDSVSRLVGPGLGGLLVQWLSAPLALLVDAVGILASGWVLSRVKPNEPEPGPSEKHPLRDMLEGLTFIWRHPLLRTLAISTSIWHVLLYSYSTLLAVFATRELGMSAGMLGAVHMLGGAGVLLGSAIIRPMVRRFGGGRTVLTGVMMTTVASALLPCVPARLGGTEYGSAAAMAAVAFVFDCGLILFALPFLSMRQKVTPDELLGRTGSTMRFFTAVAAPLGALAAGYLAGSFSVRTALLGVAAGGVALTAWLLATPQLRSVRP